MLSTLRLVEGPSWGPSTWASRAPSTEPSTGPSMGPLRRSPGGIQGEGQGLRQGLLRGEGRWALNMGFGGVKVRGLRGGRTESRHGHRSHDRGRSRIMKRGRASESPLSRVSESGTSDEGRWKSASKRQKLIDEKDLALPWTYEELPPKSIDGYKDLKAAFLAYFMQQKKYVKDPMEIHNIKQRDGETLKDFMERFKVEAGCIKGAP
ncbi:reverse transcriptase domain-containing protein [Tanacetum coccineum]